MAPRPLDAQSVFTRDDDDDHPVKLGAFSRAQLLLAVEAYYKKPCTLVKMNEGGYHKVYDISSGGQSLDSVVRVSSPVFPRDKMLSEIATLKYIAAMTSIPVPEVYTWDADASNPVGAEYMIMQKVRGVAPDGDVWKAFPIGVKLRVVSQVASHLSELFVRRFTHAGSLYLSTPTPKDDHSPNAFRVGPIVCPSFYATRPGVMTHVGMDSALQALRGPFSNTSDYLASSLRALLIQLDAMTPSAAEEKSKVYKARRVVEKAIRLCGVRTGSTVLSKKKGDTTRRTIEKAIQLCYVYPGELFTPADGLSFSFKLEDFRLANILIDPEAGVVQGYIDLEGTTLAPLWQCAVVPHWIPDPTGDMASWYGGTPDEQRAVWDTFHANVSPEWQRSYKIGVPFRRPALYRDITVEGWVAMARENFFEERLVWAKDHPGVGLPEEYHYFE